MDELVSDLKNVVSDVGLKEDYLSMNSKYVPIKLGCENFHEIIMNNDALLDDKMLFVDGGNAILFESAGLCVGFLRVGGIVYSGNKRIERNKEEFYVFVKEIDGKYFVRTYPKNNFDGLIFNPEDESLRLGLEKCNISRIISIIRRYAELVYAFEQSRDNYVILDGTLESRYPNEDIYLSKLLSKGSVCALSKTCTLTTKSGIGITKKLSDISQDSGFDKKSWYYNPLVENHNPKHDAELYFVRLYEKTNHLFRFEIQKEFKGDKARLFSILSKNSVDPIFLGYPYGLIDVDQYVRVSDDESRLLQVKISAKLGNYWSEFSKHLNATNAHSILDKIKY